MAMSFKRINLTTDQNIYYATIVNLIYYLQHNIYCQLFNRNSAPIQSRIQLRQFTIFYIFLYLDEIS